MTNPIHVVIHGNPIEGFTIIGPFDDSDAAVTHGVENLNGNGEWWVYEVELPEEGTNAESL